LTQSTFLVQQLIDSLIPGDRVIAAAERAALERDAPEALRGGGPWRRFELKDLDQLEPLESPERLEPLEPPEPLEPLEPLEPIRVSLRLSEAYRADLVENRLRVCREATASSPDLAVAVLALSSACREAQQLADARTALDRAIALAPEWAAPHYEDGKFWLAADDMERARDGFERASRLMPAFAPAFSNLGATLGELNRPEAALVAFERALAADPSSLTALNNIAVVNRELGRLDESVAASRRVIDRAPGFVFGHYNLGHALFLSGRYAEALAAYEEGQRRDPEKNRRQGCRLAMVRLANGDHARAERELWEFANAAPPDERADLLAEAYEIGSALLAAEPQLATSRDFMARVAAAVGAL
jgi:tetratricopeptide (TPR) repeat protein